LTARRSTRPRRSGRPTRRSSVKLTDSDGRRNAAEKRKAEAQTLLFEAQHTLAVADGSDQAAKDRHMRLTRQNW
jgi:hypothetical protein